MSYMSAFVEEMFTCILSRVFVEMGREDHERIKVSCVKVKYRI